MKVYIVALASGDYIYHTFSKVFKTKSGAKKELEKLKLENPQYRDGVYRSTYNLKVLCADNWHEED